MVSAMVTAVAAVTKLVFEYLLDIFSTFSVDGEAHSACLALEFKAAFGTTSGEASLFDAAGTV